MNSNKSNVEEHMVPLYHVELVRDPNTFKYRSINSVEAAAEVFHQMLDNSPVEKLAVIHCNSGGQMIGAEIVSIGGVEMVSAQPRDMLRGALLNDAAYIWVSHNHVDGMVKASTADFLFTQSLRQACDMMAMPLEDHLVVGPGGHYSIRNHQQELEDQLFLERPDLLGTILKSRLLNLPLKKF
jgi:DNA repair protein RadC